MNDLKPVRVFLEVAKLLSFAKAAQSLQMTPASITRIVAGLETDIGQQLLVRTTRQVSLTSAGAIAIARFKPIVEEFDRATEELIRSNRADMGRLRINAPMSMGVRVLPSLIESFRRAYPRIQVQTFLTDTIMDIAETECDLSVRISEPLTDKSSIWRKICKIPRFAVASPKLFERISRPEDPSDLRQDLLMAYSSAGRAEIWKFHKGGQKRDIRTGTNLVSNSGDFLYSVAAAGGGICVLPEFLVRRGLDRGEVEQVLPDWEVTHLWLTLHYQPYEQFPPLVATFTEFFEAYMREVDGAVF